MQISCFANVGQRIGFTKKKQPSPPEREHTCSAATPTLNWMWWHGGSTPQNLCNAHMGPATYAQLSSYQDSLLLQGIRICLLIVFAPVFATAIMQTLSKVLNKTN